MSQTPNAPRHGGLYDNADDALKAVRDEFSYWTTRLNDASVQMCYALIAANWVVFGSTKGILENLWAKLSLLMVMTTLAASVISAWWFSEALRKRIAYGEADDRRWKREFDGVKGADPWPFTSVIETVGKQTRRIKAFLTLIGGAFLIVGAILK